MDDGKHDILPVAGAILDHARVPVTLPRHSDADMRRDGSTTAPTVPTQPSMSAEECTAHQDSLAASASTRLTSARRTPSQPRVNPSTVEKRNRRWPRRERDPRLRGPDKRPQGAALSVGCFCLCFSSIAQCAAPARKVRDAVNALPILCFSHIAGAGDG